MARRYRKRRLRLKLKTQTIYTIVSVSLFGLAGLIVLSFFQKGTILEFVGEEIIRLFGWISVLIPLLLSTYAFFILRTKSRLSRPHVSLGLSLLVFSLTVLTQAGRIGLLVWQYMEELISAPGSAIVLTGTAIIGLTILFNTSIDQVVLTIVSFFTGIRAIVEKHIFAAFLSKKKQGFAVQKPPIRVHGGDIMEKRLTKEPSTSSHSRRLQKSTTDIPTPKAIDLGMWEFPPLSLLSSRSGDKADRGNIEDNAAIIEKTLDSFGISANVVEVNLGPAVTQYALKIALGTKISKITALGSDLALALAAPTGQIRIEAPIPGRNLVGIEIPNKSLEFVTIKQMLQSSVIRRAKRKLTVGLGLDVSGKPVITDIGRMPHVLIAGTTGSGKSVLINSFISSLLFRTTPNEVKLILVDPKRVELIGYNGIPHLLTPVIVEPEKILSALKWATQEMDRRYKQFSKVKVRNIESYNEQAGFQNLPYIVIFIDELADLMAFAAAEVEYSITRIAQMARATGIHLVVATQRPSVNVITGLIKANIPCRIAFNVSSMVDSRVILDMPGAEKLLGRGDMLYIPPDQAKPTRIQGTFVSDKDVKSLVEYLKKKGLPVEYTEEITSVSVNTKRSSAAPNIGDDGKDKLFEKALQTVCQYDKASASLIQRRLSVGYSRAARILDQLEAEGIVSQAEGSKPREVLINNVQAYYAQHQTGIQESN